MRLHLYLCLLSFYIDWHLHRALAALLLGNEELDAHRARWDPAWRPSRRRLENERRRSEEGLVIQSSATLMAELATRACRQC